MHPPFSPRGENGPCTVQKTRQEGDFGLPLLDHPFKRHKEGAAAPSLETPPTERQREEKQDALTSTLGICANVTTCGISASG